MQYRETDFNFVSRLMEQEGIYYYFKHTDGHNTLVLTDSTSKHATVPGYETIPFISPEQVVRPELEHISSWDFQREIQPGVYVHDDYDFERPSVDAQDAEGAVAGPTRRATTRSTTIPGHYLQKPDGEQYAAVRHRRAAAASSRRRRRSTNARGVSVGALFTLEDHPRDDQNREYLIVGGELRPGVQRLRGDAGGRRARATAAASPRCRAKQQFRPQRASRRSRSCRGRRRRSSSGRAARRSTPTSTAA